VRTAREGFTIVELLLVLLLGTLLLGAVYDSMSRQERAYGMFNAMAATQQDTRIGMDLLSAELRELSPGAGDLLMATEDSLRIRALRKFGIVCITDKNNKRFGVAKIGATDFAAGDSIAIYVDGDSLKAKDDTWQTTQIQGVASMLNCASTLGLLTGILMPSSELQQVTVVGAGLKFDSIYPGAPVRSYELLTYRVGTVSGDPWVLRVKNDTITPLFGPVAPTEGFQLAYFDTLGTQLTSFPLSAAARGSVARIRVELRARRQTGTNNRMHTDSLISDVFVRGS
jgi:hypothetical protein